MMRFRLRGWFGGRFRERFGRKFRGAFGGKFRGQGGEWFAKRFGVRLFKRLRTRLFERLDRMPMLKAVVPLATGIALSEWYVLPGWLLAAAFLLTGLAALLLRSSLCSLGMFLAAGFAAAQLRAAEPLVPRNVHTAFELRIEGIPSERGSYTSAEARVTAWRNPANGRWHASGDRVIVRADSLTPLFAGERLRCRATLRPLRGGAESYRRLMTRRGFAGTLWLAQGNILEPAAGPKEISAQDRTPQLPPEESTEESPQPSAGPKEISAQDRTPQLPPEENPEENPQHLPAQDRTLHIKAVERLRRLALTPDAGAVVRAMAAGDRSAVTPALRTLYSHSGFSHLMAVSGLHTGIVFLLCNTLLWWMPLLRRGHLARNMIVTAAIWIFVAAAGFPPSAVRAAVMCTLLQFALVSASEYVAMNSLAAAAFAMLLWNPAWLGDISFQLSFIAVAAILAWGVPLCRRIRTRRRVLDAVLHAYLIGAAATIATAPLVCHTFGILPLAGVLFNPAAILLATAVVSVAVVWMLLPLTTLAPAFAWVLECAVAGIELLARLCVTVPGGTVPYTLGGGATTALYLFFAAATLAAWSVETKKTVHLPA